MKRSLFVFTALFKSKLSKFDISVQFYKYLFFWPLTESRFKNSPNLAYDFSKFWAVKRQRFQITSPFKIWIYQHFLCRYLKFSLLKWLSVYPLSFWIDFYSWKITWTSFEIEICICQRTKLWELCYFGVSWRIPLTKIQVSVRKN